jgi:hypothetical protein
MSKSDLNDLRLSLLPFMLLATLVGCSDGLARVEGTVTFNGEPVSRGMINLEPVDGKGPVAGASVESGTYSMEGVPPGEKIVRISAVYSKGVNKQSDGSEQEICEDLLPKEYGQTSKHRLTVELPITKKDYLIEGTDPRKAK